MEKYLNRCVDSLVNTNVLDLLEIIIVNDGSKDNTLKIAKDYEKRYPQSVVVIDKQNGHYGSCINASLKIATGKYFRVLDSDDWLDSNALNVALNSLSKINTDVYFSKCMVHDYSQNKQIPRIYKDIEYNKVLDLNKFQIPECMLSMHSLTYRTKLLRDIYYKQTEGICYTDTEYVCYPMCKARTLYAEDLYLYQYYVGRDDQSMSFDSIEKNLHHLYPLIERFTKDESYKDGNKNARYIHDHFVTVSSTQLFLFSIIFCKKNKERDLRNRKFLNDIKQSSVESYDTIMNIKAKGIIPYVKIWYKYPMLAKILILGRPFYKF